MAHLFFILEIPVSTGLARVSSGASARLTSVITGCTHSGIQRLVEAIIAARAVQSSSVLTSSACLVARDTGSLIEIEALHTGRAGRCRDLARIAGKFTLLTNSRSSKEVVLVTLEAVRLRGA